MKAVAIHQPNYLPWAGYFYKIACADVFVFLDDAQFTKGGFINRNKIKSAQGIQWLSIPVHVKLGWTIEEVGWRNCSWKEKHLKTLKSAYGKAAFFDELIEWFVKNMNESTESNLADLNVRLLCSLSRELGLKCPLVRSSELGIEGKGDERLVQIVKRMGGTTYLSGYGGSHYQDEEKFKSSGVELQYYDFVAPVYPQLWGDFVPGLSIIDMLFNCGFEESANHIRSAGHRV